MELNGGGYACSGELSTAKSDFFREKRVISAAAPWRSEPCSLSVLCTYVHISACMVCVCVCGDTSRQRNRKQSLENTSFPWVLSEIKQAGDSENKNQEDSGWDFPEFASSP